MKSLLRSLCPATALAALFVAGCGGEKPMPARPAAPSAPPAPTSPAPSTSQTGAPYKSISPQAAASPSNLNEPSVTAANGLEMTVRMGKSEFLVGEGLDIFATLKNTSDKAYGLFDVDFTIPYGVRIVAADSGVAWEPYCGAKYDRVGGVSAVLRPGQAYAARGAMSFLGHLWRFGLNDYLPPGTYEMTMTLCLENPEKRGYTYRNVGFGSVSTFWSGEIKSKPVRFAVKSNRHGTGDAVNQEMAESLPKRLADIGAEPTLGEQGADFEAYRFFSYGWRKSHPLHITIPPGSLSEQIPLRLAHSTAAEEGPGLTLKSYHCQAYFEDRRTGAKTSSSNIVRFGIE
jgi:hypothetical protein